MVVSYGVQIVEVDRWYHLLNVLGCSGVVQGFESIRLNISLGVSIVFLIRCSTISFSDEGFVN